MINYSSDTYKNLRRIDKNANTRVEKVFGKDDIKKIYVYQNKEYMSGLPNSQPVNNSTPNSNSQNNQNNQNNNQNVNRLYSRTGKVYEFNRGIIMFDENGKKHVDIFDGTRKHHGPTMIQVASDEFGVILDIDENDPDVVLMDIQIASNASTYGLSTMLLEGNMCQLYIPDNLTNEEIEEIMKEVEPRSSFEFIIVRTNRLTGEFEAAEDLTCEQVLEELESLKTKEELNEEKIEEERMNYINSLLDYTKLLNISVEEYFMYLAVLYRMGRSDLIEDFERNNPFLTEEDIELLINSDERNISTYFANTMGRVIEKNLNKEKDIKDTSSSEDKEEDIKEPTKEEKYNYIKELLKYVRENNMTLNDYYKLVGNAYLNNDLSNLQQFETNNPFLTKKDIKLLVESNEENILIYFANTMERVVLENIRIVLNELNNTNEDNNEKETSNNKKEIETNDEDEIDNQIESEEDNSQEEIININEEILDSMNGFKLNKEGSKKAAISGFIHDKGKVELTKKKVVKCEAKNITDGEYVNIVEYLFDLALSLEEQYGKEANVELIDEDGNKQSIIEVLSKVYKDARVHGVITFGKKDEFKNIKTFEELISKTTLEKGKFKGKEITKGVFVKKDIIKNEMSKYKIVINKEKVLNENNQKTK